MHKRLPSSYAPGRPKRGAWRRKAAALAGVTSSVLLTAAVVGAAPAHASGVAGTIGLIQSYQGAGMTYVILGNSELKNSSDGAGGFNTDHCGDGNQAGTVGGVPTSATVSLPSGAVVKGAFLWWTAMTAEAGTPTPNVPVGSTASLTLPNGTVRHVASQQNETVISGATYQGQFANITSDIPADPNGRYTLPIPGGINLTECSVGYNVRNWQMMLVYSSPATVSGANKVYVYSGMQGLDSGPITTPITGYEVPSSGNTAGRLSVMFSDGDSAIPGETLTSTDTTFLPSGFPANYGNSSGTCGPVNTAGTADCQTATLPVSGTVSYPNNNKFSNAWDVDEHDGSFAPGSTSSTLTASTNGDVLIFDGIALQVPTALLQITTSTSTPSVTSGGLVTYTIKASNPSNASISGASVTDTLPHGFSFASSGAVALTGGAGRSATINPTAGSSTLHFGTFSLPAHSSVSITFTAKAPAVSADTRFSDLASGTATDALVNSSSAVAVEVTPVVKATATPTVLPTAVDAGNPGTGGHGAPGLELVGSLVALGAAGSLVFRYRRVRRG